MNVVNVEIEHLDSLKGHKPVAQGMVHVDMLTLFSCYKKERAVGMNFRELVNFIIGLP